ncbi:MAG: nitroreductase family protein [Odoribacteraceae bacterium]|jgi:nitroreductase|nr:nitroreductase family protein [Odoribacteraceae bacterium]
MLRDLLRENRSYRRFHQKDRVGVERLRDWVSLTRFCASGRNAQALKYRLVHDEERCARVFETLAWAGYLKDWRGPEEGERPAAYLVQLLDTAIAGDCFCDDGIQAQTILLGAVEDGFGGCIVKAFREAALRAVLSLPASLVIRHVIALGRPAERVVLEDMRGDDFRYWREADGSHHVPKRGTDDLIA